MTPFNLWNDVFLLMRLLLAVLENSLLPMGWDSSHAILKVISVVYICLSHAETKKSE